MCKNQLNSGIVRVLEVRIGTKLDSIIFLAQSRFGDKVGIIFSQRFQATIYFSYILLFQDCSVAILVVCILIIVGLCLCL